MVDALKPTRSTIACDLPLSAFTVVAVSRQEICRTAGLRSCVFVRCGESLFPQYVSEVEQIQHRRPKVAGDFRRALDDKSVDAIIVATPDHWHALATIWGCQAGKDVYVEKPVSHSPWEGRKMVEAARRYQRIVQAGLQNRSAALQHSCQGVHRQRKAGHRFTWSASSTKSHGPTSPAMPDGDPPAGLNWDMWTGPAPESKYNENYHRGWNHFWRFLWWRHHQRRRPSDGPCPLGRRQNVSCNRCTRPVAGTPKKGVFESPDTQVAVFQFDDLVMTFELTLYTPYMIKSDQALRDSDMYPYWPQNAERIEIYGSQGLMIIGSARMRLAGLRSSQGPQARDCGATKRSVSRR